jgi:hypothetical protein
LKGFCTHSSKDTNCNSDSVVEQGSLKI